MTGDQIKQWREERGISRMELSRLTGVSYHSIQRWEIGKGSPSPMALRQLKEVMEKQNGIEESNVAVNRLKEEMEKEGEK